MIRIHRSFHTLHRLSFIRSRGLTRFCSHSVFCSRRNKIYRHTTLLKEVKFALNQPHYCFNSAQKSAPSIIPMGEIIDHAPSSGLSSFLWKSSLKEALDSLYSEFVLSLAAGTLPIHTFRHYVKQDATYLDAFAKAYGIARDSAPTEEAKNILQSQQDAVYAELQLHSSYCIKWGIDISKLEAPSAATSEYTTFLMDTAKNGNASCTVSAMLPCMRLYAFLGKNLKSAMPLLDESHPYIEWIQTYASTEFENSASELEYLFNSLTSNSPVEEHSKFLNLYKKAMNLEFLFFSAQPFFINSALNSNNNSDSDNSNGNIIDNVENANLIDANSDKSKNEDNNDWVGFNLTHLDLILICDFDLTCTLEDSSRLIAELAINESEDKISKLDELVKLYSEEYTQVLTRHIPSPYKSPNPKTPVKFNPDGLNALLKDISEFEVKANKRVVDSKILEGIEKSQLSQRAKNHQLRDDCACVLKKLSQNQVKVCVMSVCWSQTFLSSALSNALSIDIFNHEIFPNFSIISNELSFDNDGMSNGGLCIKLQHALDKKLKFDEIVNEFSIQDKKILHEKDTKQQKMTIYVGDSLTDLPPLLSSDIGILISQGQSHSQTLLNVADYYGISIFPLVSSVIDSMKRRKKGQKDYCSFKNSGTLFCADGWEEINSFLHRCQFT